MQELEGQLAQAQQSSSASAAEAEAVRSALEAERQVALGLLKDMHVRANAAELVSATLVQRDQRPPL